MYNIRYWSPSPGKSPVKDYIDHLEPKLGMKMRRNIGLVALNGPISPYSQPVKEGIFEIRARVGTNCSRILFFFERNAEIVLANGFTKKTEKTPTDEFMKTMRIKKEMEAQYEVC